MFDLQITSQLQASLEKFSGVPATVKFLKCCGLRFPAISADD